MSPIPENSVCVLIEETEGKLGDGSLELVAEATRLSEKLHAGMVAIIPGSLPEDQTALLAQHGARQIVFLDHGTFARDKQPETAAGVLAGFIRNSRPQVLLAIHTINQGDLISRIAALLGLGMVACCDRVDIDAQGQLVDTKPIYAGKAAATCLNTAARPRIATLNPDALELRTPNPKNTAEVVSVRLESDAPAPRLRKVGFTKGDPRSIQLSEADIVVCAGMGIGSKQNLRLVEELANAIGGSVAGTRRVIDEGWLTLPRQVGLTGKTVRPRLYFGCGVSGAIQHTMGMKDSRAIVAVNLDRNAPIFKIADVAILGDVLKVLPVLTEHLKSVLSQVSRPTVGDVLNAAAGMNK